MFDKTRPMSYRPRSTGKYQAHPKGSHWYEKKFSDPTPTPK